MFEQRAEPALTERARQTGVTKRLYLGPEGGTLGNVDMSVGPIPRVNVKTSGRHIPLSACREAARVQASVAKSQVIEPIAEEHDTTSQSHSASRPTGTDMPSI